MANFANLCSGSVFAAFVGEVQRHPSLLFATFEVYYNLVVVLLVLAVVLRIALAARCVITERRQQVEFRTWSDQQPFAVVGVLLLTGLNPGV